MITRWDSKCSICGRPTKAGIDHYDVESKEGYHRKCRDDAENTEPTPEVLALSQRLGFLSFDAALHWPWSQMRGDGQRTLWAREE